MHKRAGGGAILTLMVLISAAGCGPFTVPMGPGPIAVKGDGNSIEMGVCAPALVTRVVGEYQSSDSKEWVTFLEAEGEVQLARGDILTADFISENFDVILSETPPLHDVGLNIGLEYADGALLGLYSVDGDGLPTDRWLHNDESLTTGVCA